jgi:hypothetical protein
MADRGEFEGAATVACGAAKVPCAAVQGVGEVMGVAAGAATAGCSTIVGNCTRCPSADEVPHRHHAKSAPRTIPAVRGSLAFKLGTEYERRVSAERRS